MRGEELLDVVGGAEDETVGVGVVAYKVGLFGDLLESSLL